MSHRYLVAGLVTTTIFVAHPCIRAGPRLKRLLIVSIAAAVTDASRTPSRDPPHLAHSFVNQSIHPSIRRRLLRPVQSTVALDFRSAPGERAPDVSRRHRCTASTRLATFVLSVRARLHMTVQLVARSTSQPRYKTGEGPFVRSFST